MIIGQNSLAGTAQMMTGGGIDAVESRVKQLEGMIQAVEGNKPANPRFQTFLNSNASGTSSAGTSLFPHGYPAGVDGANAIQFTPNGITGTLSARAKAFQPIVEKYAAQYGVDKNLVNAVIRQESGFNPAAVSRAGARGLMQLMPGTAHSLGVADPMNPEQNIEGGVRLLKNLLNTYHGNIPLALAAYNAGGGAVQKHGGIPPYRETQHYVKTILASYLAQKHSDSNLIASRSS